ncbi:ABC transporter ATP-binding protein [Cryobacterium aureum]|uniref:ABC transporter ATP-binding protein n=1 Tax=Cryobacterium aureum TaxID=995037 RepID=UPI0013752B89|nr:ABC transporter ATP-binding protein [Cryobacterium aureum]
MLDNRDSTSGLAEDVVTLTGVSKSYGSKLVVDDVSFRVRRGEIFGLLGPNGAGKSTLLESIVGLRSVSAGTISVLGAEPVRQRAFITANVSIQPQSASLFDTLSVRETLRLYASFHSRPGDVDEVMQRVGLANQADTWARNLSGGQLRRLLVGVAIVGRPQIVVLDEPSAGLDPGARQSLLGLIRGLKESGTTVLFSTHDMQEASDLCDRVAILAGGRIQALGSPDELIRLSDATSTVSFLVPADTDLSFLDEQFDSSAFSRSTVSIGIRVVVTTSDPDAILRQLTFRCRVAAREYSVRQSTLEDYFLKIVATSSAATSDLR